MGIGSEWIPFTIIEEIVLARVADEQLIKGLEPELMKKIYALRQTGMTSPEEVAETLDLTLRGAQTWIGRLDQLLAKISDDGN